MELKKPENQTELQTLLNYILKMIGDKRKMKVKISSRLKKYNGLAHTPDYIRHGRRKITISKLYFGYSELNKLINTLIHEIAHFKFSRTQKLRKLWLKHKYGKYAYDSETKKQIRKHHHTKRFKQLVKRLEARFWNNHKRNS